MREYNEYEEHFKKILSPGQIKALRIIQRKVLNVCKFFGKFLGITIPEGFRLALDVFHCNLRCVMCPNGEINELEGPGKGFMSLELFKKIVDKFVNENVKIKRLEIGNWGEPLLNPDLPKMIRYAKSKPGFIRKGTYFWVNTNLTHLPDPVDFLKSGMDAVRISISGMTQKVYSRNHIGGDIKSVRSNILKLVKVKNAEKLKNVELILKFHNYIYNKSDAELAKKFCKEHGLTFWLHGIFIPCLECSIKFQEEKERLSKLYSQFIDLKREMRLMKTINLTDVENCRLRKNRVTVNFDGQLYRCCGVFEKKYFMGSIFDFKIRDIPKIKSEVCKKCAETPISWRRIDRY